jgi:surface carbohydrate biosynthesis protein
MDVLIFYEHKAREFAVVSALAALLEKAGRTVKIAHIYHDTRAFRLLRPKLVAVPFFYGDYDETLKRLFEEYPGPILNLAFEQILYGIQKEMKEPRNIALSERIRHCAWSQEFVDFLCKAGVREDRVERVGSPNFGLALPPYIEIEPSREVLARASGLDPEKKWILFTENYRWAFITSSQTARFVSWGGTRKSIEEAIDYCRRSLRSLIIEIGQLANGGFFRDRRLVFRLRPSTRRDLFSRFLSENGLVLPAGVIVNKEFNARAWIRHSDIIVSSFSTTICDAALLGRPIFIYSPFPCPEALKYDWTDLVDAVETMDPAALLDPARGRPDRLAAHVKKGYLGFGDPMENLKETCLRVLAAEGADGSAGRGILDGARAFWLELTRLTHAASYPLLLRSSPELDKRWRIRPYVDDLVTAFGERRAISAWKRVVGR